MDTPVSSVLAPFILGIVVPDIKAAMDELQDVLPDWSQIVEAPAAQWSVRVSYAITDEPYIQVIEGPAGSPWDGTARGRIDHVDVWASDLDADSARLEAAGFVLEIDNAATDRPWRLYRGRTSALRVEIHRPNEEAASMRRETFGLPRPGSGKGAPPFRELGLLVDDLEAAVGELEAGLGLSFPKRVTTTIDGSDCRIAPSVEGPSLVVIEAAGGEGGDLHAHPGGLYYAAFVRHNGTNLVSTLRTKSGVRIA